MIRTSKFLLTVVMAVLAVQFAEGQQKGQPKGQPGQVGPGLKGQMNWAQQGGYYGGIGQSPWFSDPAIRQQLKLTEQQYNQLNQAYGTAWKNYQQGLEKMSKTATEDELQAL